MSVAGARTVSGDETTGRRGVGFGPGQGQDDFRQRGKLQGDDCDFRVCTSEVNSFAESGGVLPGEEGDAAVMVHRGIAREAGDQDDAGSAHHGNQGETFVLSRNERGSFQAFHCELLE